MSSRFRDSENNVEANFVINSEDYCPKLLASQLRHSKQHLERSNTEGARLRNLLEETRTANANVAPEVTRPHPREAQLTTRVSTMTNHETEFKGQLQNLQPENTRINALMIQIQITNSSITLHIRN